MIVLLYMANLLWLAFLVSVALAPLPDILQSLAERNAWLASAGLGPLYLGVLK